MRTDETGTLAQSVKKCRWAPPFQQPIVFGREKVLACNGDVPFSLPPRCCRCGSKTEEEFPVKIITIAKGDKLAAIAQFVAESQGHIASAVIELTREKVQVPCCSSCRFLHRLGFIAGLLLVLLSAWPFAMIIMQDRDTKLREPVWHVAALIGASAMFIFAGIAVSYYFTRAAVPVIAYRINGGNYYYEFWSPRYQKLLLSSGVVASNGEASV